MAMSRIPRLFAQLACVAGALGVCWPVWAQSNPIRVGFPIVMSGAGAQFGVPVLKGAQMFTDEINAAGGVLGRKIEIVPRDSKNRPDEAVRVSRELIARENIDFLVGTFTSAEGPAVSEIAKENKIVFLAPVPATDRLTAPDALHPYVFRCAKNTTTEGRSSAELMAKWPVTRIATIAPDYAYGQDAVKAFIAHIKKLKPNVEIVDQQWPKLNEPDYTPFITAQMAKKPEAVFSVVCCGNFDTFAKQAKPLKYFESINLNMLAVGEAGSVEATRSLGSEYPVGIWGNTYDAFYWNGGPTHRAYVERVQKFLNDPQPSSWVIQGYIAMQFLTQAIKNAGSTESDKVSKALLGLTVETPHGAMTIREKDHQCNRGMLYGQAVRDEKYAFPILNPVSYVDPAKFMD